MPTRTRRTAIVAVASALLTLVACGSGDDDAVLTIYTSVTQDTVDAVVAGFQSSNPDTEIEVFRAATGELTARIAAELRDDALPADVLWLTDPLSMQQYDRDGLLLAWSPSNINAVDSAYRTETFFGTRILNIVIVASPQAASSVRDWSDLTTVDGEVAIPDPSFAGSAFGALAFFSTAPEYGTDFYAALADNGGVQVRSPGDVVTGVAEGVYGAGMSLDRSVRDAIADGSPVEMVWPASGAIAIYSPIAVVDGGNIAAGEAFVEHVLSEPAQRAIAGTGWEPIRGDVGWDRSGRQLTVDWGAAFDRQDALLTAYLTAFDV